MVGVAAGVWWVGKVMNWRPAKNCQPGVGKCSVVRYGSGNCGFCLWVRRQCMCGVSVGVPVEWKVGWVLGGVGWGGSLGSGITPPADWHISS